MQETEQVVQAYMLIFALTVLSVFASSSPYLCILFSGLLLITVSIRSLTEEPDRIVFAVQIGLSAAFVLFSGGVWSCLTFYECRIFKQRWPQIFLPAFVFCAFQPVVGGIPLPWIIVWALILIGIAGGLYLAEGLVIGYLSARNKNDKSVSISAVN